jgi:hypothetical protein
MRGLILFTIAGAVAAAQDWIAMGAGGSVSTPANGGVEFKYELGKKQFAAAVLPANDSLASMKSLRFRAKTDHDTTVGVLLSERKPGGGNYSATFWSPAGVWQQIELTPRDFELSDGPNDPKDPDGKLDLDQVEGIGIVDLAILFENAAERDKIVVTKATPGAHTILIDNFEVRSTGPAATRNTIDAFDRGFLQWMTPGGMALKFVPETGPLGAPSLKATYEETSGPFAFLVRRVGGLDLAKAKHLTFDIASENEATIMVALEMKQGARYHQTIYPPAGRKVFHVDLSLGDFERESETGPEKFDPSQWKTIGLTDITGATGGGTSANTFWLGNLRVKE